MLNVYELSLSFTITSEESNIISNLFGDTITQPA